VQAVAAGTVLMSISDSGPVSGLLKGGKLRALGLTAARRNPAFPDVPTMAEAGLGELEVALWTGIVAPAGTPPEVISRLNAALRNTVALPEVVTAFAAIAVEPRSTTPDEYRALIARDSTRWKQVAATANIKLE
jgi:tripartite-type tricarboxylate transporter receptor subunit TctC